MLFRSEYLFMNNYKISEYDSELLVNDKDISIFFEDVVKGREPKVVTSWITGEIFSYLKKEEKSIKEVNISPKKIGDLIDLIIDGTISNRQAKEVFDEYVRSDQDAKIFIEERGLVQLSDVDEIEQLIENVINDNPKMVNEYKNGKDRLFGFFVGQAMKLSKGKANPQVVNKILQKKLND